MKAKRIAMLAATGTAAFMVGFAAVGLVAMAADTVTQVTAERTTGAQAVDPVVEELASVVPETGPKVEIVDEWPTPEEPQIWGGTYYVDESTKLPRSFRDVESFTFEMYDYDKQDDKGEWGVPIPPKGTITVGKKTYKLTRIGVGKQSIGFQTEELNGVSYRFTGKFNNLDYCETGEELPDVTGRLIRLEANKWAAEAEMSFFSEGCGC